MQPHEANASPLNPDKLLLWKPSTTQPRSQGVQPTRSLIGEVFEVEKKKLRNVSTQSFGRVLQLTAGM